MSTSQFNRASGRPALTLVEDGHDLEPLDHLEFVAEVHAFLAARVYRLPSGKERATWEAAMSQLGRVLDAAG